MSEPYRLPQQQGVSTNMQDLVSIACVFHRGGTSRGLFFHKRDLPARDRWDVIFMAAMGTPDVRQIDGVGGATSHTSKVVVISPSHEPSADVDYLFAQVGISDSFVDYKGMCGNLLAAVGPFAIDEGIVKATEPVTSVRIFNVNTRKHFLVHVPVQNGRSLSQGNYSIYGVAGAGVKYRCDYLNPAGAYSGEMLPTGNVVDRIELEGLPPFDITILDVANPMAFVRAEDLGIQNLAEEDPRTVSFERLALLERIRSHACYIAGFIDDPELAAKKMPALPRLALVQPPSEARTFGSQTLGRGQMDLYSHMVSMQRMHQSYAGTGAVCLAVAACVAGSVVNSVYESGEKSGNAGIQSATVRFGHPSGLLEVDVETDENGTLKRVSMGRTARRLMDGHVYVPARLLK